MPMFKLFSKAMLLSHGPKCFIQKFSVTDNGQWYSLPVEGSQIITCFYNLT